MELSPGLYLNQARRLIFNEGVLTARTERYQPSVSSSKTFCKSAAKIDEIVNKQNGVFLISSDSLIILSNGITNGIKGIHGEDI